MKENQFWKELMKETGLRANKLSESLGMHHAFISQRRQRPGLTIPPALHEALVRKYGHLELVNNFLNYNSEKPVVSYGSKSIQPKQAQVILEKACFLICEEGDDYNCNIFLSPDPLAGPYGLIYMMQATPEQSQRAVEIVTKAYQELEFYLENDKDVISVWLPNN